MIYIGNKLSQDILYSDGLRPRAVLIYSNGKLAYPEEALSIKSHLNLNGFSLEGSRGSWFIIDMNNNLSKSAVSSVVGYFYNGESRLYALYLFIPKSGNNIGNPTDLHMPLVPSTYSRGNIDYIITTTSLEEAEQLDFSYFNTQKLLKQANVTTEPCALRYVNWNHFPKDMPGYAIPSLSVAKEIYLNSESFKLFCSEMLILGMSENFPKWVWTSTFVKDTSPLEAYLMNLTTGEIRTYTVASSAGGLILVQNYSGLH